MNIFLLKFIGCWLGGLFYNLGNLDDNKRVVTFEDKEFILNRPEELELNL